MMLLQDSRVLLHLLRGQQAMGDHAERLERFYAPQAAHYDRFRERLLHGRRELIERLDPQPGQSVVPQVADRRATHREVAGNKGNGIEVPAGLMSDVSG